jgi:hypothetical protein
LDRVTMGRFGRPLGAILWAPWRDAGRELLDTTDVLLGARRSPLLSAALLVLATLAAFVVYVPLHELAHAAGCVLAGGSVAEVEISRAYGGAFLERVLPFVRAGGAYAGRLAKFDTGGSDLVYLATDFAPFVLTLLGAFPLLRLARSRHSIACFACGSVLLTAPFISLIGDFYEMGSILVSDALRALLGRADAPCLDALRHDDLLGLLAEFPRRFPQDRLFWAGAIGGAAALGWFLAGITLAVSRWMPLARAREGNPRGSNPPTAQRLGPA